jgi:ABC-type multidrug transport system fused ATPase/permease subunit
MGLLEPTSGSIEIDGEKLTESNRRAWQTRIAHVPQSIYLSDASIAENIAFGINPKEIDMSRVVDAAKRAQLANFIDSLPKKYKNKVGERGVRLSGGQRQRIGLARALYKKSDVLVLDEATSALDSETEESVMKAIGLLDHELTVLIVAHRLSTLKECDQIYELANGRLLRQINYNEIIEKIDTSGNKYYRDAAVEN